MVSIGPFGTRFGELLVPQMLFGAVLWVQAWGHGLGPSQSLLIGELRSLIQCQANANCSYRDRPWQAFPITILTGAYIGYAVGTFVARTQLVFGKRVRFSEEDAGDAEKKTN